MKFTLLLLVLLISFGGFTQSRESEFEVWTSAEFQWKINKKWKVKVKNQERFRLQQNPLKQAFIQGEIKRKFFTYHDVFLRYRHAYETDEEHNVNRISLGYRFKMDVHKKISLYNQSIYQYEQRVYTREPQTTFRNKTGAQFNLKKKQEIDVSYELFIEQKDVYELRNHRATASYSKEWKKYFSTEVFYRVDFSVNRKQNTNQHILGLSFNFKV